MSALKMGRRINAVLEAVDDLQDELPVDRVRPRARLDDIRDQLVLLALDLGLSINPAKPKLTETKPDGEADRPAGQTG